MWLLQSNQFVDNLEHSNEMMDFFEFYDYKELSDAFEIITVIFPAVVLTYFITYVRMRNLKENLAMLFFEFFVLVIPMLLNLTIFVQNILQTIALILAIVMAFLVTIFFGHMSKRAQRKVNKIITSQQHFTFITNARATINLLTAISILAVDFKIFPTRFGKTKKFGFSLMDLGVGLFVYSNGIVASKKQESFFKIFKDSAFLFLLGLGRFLITTESKYHVSPWEYGVHWNFFFTLGVTKVFSSLLIKLIGDRFLFIIGPLLLALHEMLLRNGLQDFVFGPGDRTKSLIVANREGIVSSLGYIALYLFSIPIGNLLKDTSSYRAKVMKITALSMALLLATFILNYTFCTSRRIANSAYCCWTLFVGVFMTECFYICEWIHKIFTKCKHIPPILLNEAINYNGLVYFVVCNLLTGLVNIIFYTRKIGTVQSLLILSVYLFVSCTLVVVMFTKKWRVKL